MEGVDAGEHLVERDPDGEDVGPLVQLLRHRLLGAHVDELPLDHPRFGLDRAHLALGDPEVDDLHVAGVADEDVLRVQIAVHQVERAPGHVGQVVGVARPVADLLGDGAAQLRVQLLLAAQRPVDDVAQRLPLHVLHGDEIAAGHFSELEDLDHVAVVHLRGQPRLAEECLDELLALGQVAENLLHHQDLLESGRALLLGEKDLAHAAGGKLLHQEVFAEGGTDVVGCGFRH